MAYPAFEAKCTGCRISVTVKKDGKVLYHNSMLELVDFRHLILELKTFPDLSGKEMCEVHCTHDNVEFIKSVNL